MVGFEDRTDETGMLISHELTVEAGELVFLVRVVRRIDDEEIWDCLGDTRDQLDCIRTSYRNPGQGATRLSQVVGIADDGIDVRPRRGVELALKVRPDQAIEAGLGEVEPPGGTLNRSWGTPGSDALVIRLRGRIVLIQEEVGATLQLGDQSLHVGLDDIV